MKLVNDQRTRGAEIYLCFGTSSTWRIRVQQYPDNEPGWFGGKILWGHDQDSQDKAYVIAAQWTERGILPEPPEWDVTVALKRTATFKVRAETRYDAERRIMHGDEGRQVLNDLDPELTFDHVVSCRRTQD
jgi:hypothetical protein